MDKEFSTKMMDKLETIKPTPKWKFLLGDVLRIIGLFTVVGLAILALSVFLVDLLDNTTLFIFVESFKPSFLGLFLFEFLILALFSYYLAYVSYRQTDWPLVRQGKWLIIGSLSSVLIIGGVISLISWQNSPRNPINRIRNAAIKTLAPNKKDTLATSFKEKQIFVGRIQAMMLDKKESSIQVHNKYETVTFKATAKQLENLQLNDGIAIKYTEKDGQKSVKQIKKLN